MTTIASKNNIYNSAKKISANDDKLIALIKKIKTDIQNQQENKENDDQ